MIARLELKNFQAFRDLSISFSPGINIIIGENGTGKTQLLKAAYALLYGGNMFDPFSRPADDVSDFSNSPRGVALFTGQLLRVFMPLNRELGEMFYSRASDKSEVSIYLDGQEESPKFAQVSFQRDSEIVEIGSNYDYGRSERSPVFIPTKEVLSFMEGFSSLYKRYRLSFDQTYQDICLLLDLPELNLDQLQPKARHSVDRIEEICGGQFQFYGGGRVTFRTRENEYSANSIAEGLRKVGMLSRLLLNGSIQPGQSGVLLWDEPEANLNPKLMRMLVEILVELAREGQQIILATHEYVLLKWFDLLANQEGDRIAFHTLYRNQDTNEIEVKTVNNYLAAIPNAITETYKDITKEQVRQTLGNLGK